MFLVFVWKSRRQNQRNQSLHPLQGVTVILGVHMVVVDLEIHMEVMVEVVDMKVGMAQAGYGAATETELEDCKLGIEDAKNATFAAIEEGIVPGSGAALVHLSTFVPIVKEKLEDPHEHIGANIVQKLFLLTDFYYLAMMEALVAPASLIAYNAGVEGEVVDEKGMASEWVIG